MKKRLIYFLCSIFAVLGLLFATQDVFADPPTTNPDTSVIIPVDPGDPNDDITDDPETDEEVTTDATCYDQVGGIGWLICPVTGTLAKAIDSVYGIIESLLKVNPISTDQDSPIYLVWEYIRNITNVIFIIFLLVVIYSQVTGFGITNYGIKKVLPRIIIAAILVNLSYIICALAVDVSNILGSGLGAVFTNIYEIATAGETVSYSVGEIAGTILGTVAVGAGATIAGLAIVGGIGAALWMLVPVIFAGIVAVITALIVLAARQALIIILIMIAPLAFVAYLLPNTEKWFKKWKDILLQMLIFYPMFAVLFSASQLASWVIISSATNVFGIILGVAVQVLPLFFTFSLMKMSNTILGNISTGIQKFTSPAQKGIGTWADSRRSTSKARHIAANRTPSARLSNYLAYRKTLRETDTSDAEKIIEGRATIRAQRKISGGFDANDPTKVLRANRYTRRAKTASTTSSLADTAKSDTSNLLGAYGSSYGGAHTANLANSRRLPLRAFDKHLSNVDQRLADAGAEAYLHANRTAFTAESNEEADWSYLFKTYADAANGGYGTYNYRRWLNASAGELGPAGISSVLGQIIAKADAAEQRRRKYDRILLNKYGHDKRTFRNMVVGYYVDDDGFATDKDGEHVMFYDPILRKNRKELVPGELLLKDPSKLVRYDVIDEDGKPYYDWKDQKGNFLMRVYREDVPYMKEAFSSDDIPINDPINSLYAILAGIYPDDPANEGIGLANFSTTLGRALQAANYKEKTAGMGAQAIASISRRQIKNHAQLGIEFLDNIKKTGKASNFNTQDAIHIKQFAAYLDPDNWPILFPEEGIMSYVNVNGEPLEGLDEDGNKVKANIATYEEKMRQVKSKYLFPVVKKFATFLARVTSNTVDNQKPGAGDELAKLKDLLDEHWSGAEAVREGFTDAYAQDSNFIETSRAVRQRLQTLPDIIPTHESDIRLIIDELFNAGNDIDSIASTIRYHFGDHPRLGAALEEFDQFMQDNPYIEEEQLLEAVLDIIQPYLSD
ncbi:MFS transporter [Candidatus Saccharibacteria bacterium]|nr:MFS transporter [Candidatus Saccharibacteria bacterium]